MVTAGRSPIIRNTISNGSGCRCGCEYRGYGAFKSRLSVVLFTLVLFLNFVSVLTAPAPVAVLAAGLPEPSSVFYVNDLAGVIDSQTEQAIISEAGKLDDATKAQIVAVTVKSLDGRPLEEYATELFRQWGIGSKESDNGVLILVDTGGRQSRIEVGYGLEGILPDGKTGRIQDDYMIPYFRAGDYGKGILEGFRQVLAEVYGEYGYKADQNGSWVKDDGSSVPAGTVSGTTIKTAAKTAVKTPAYPGGTGYNGSGSTYPYPGDTSGSSTGSESGSVMIIFIVIALVIADFIFLRGAVTLTLLRVMISFGWLGGRRWPGGGSSFGGGRSSGSSPFGG